MTNLLAVGPAGDLGGAELGLLRLLGRLRACGWSVTLTSPAGPLRERAASAGLAWRPAGVAGPGGPRGRRLARRADVVYLNGTGCARLLRGVGGARSVLHVHGMPEKAARAWSRADVLLVDSEAAAERLGELRERAHVVGAPIEPEPPPVRPPWPPDPGHPVVGYVGRIEPRKGVDDLVRAAPALAVAGARVVVVGGDPYGVTPQYLQALKSTGAVEHYEWVDGAAGLLGALDVLVYPAREEAFGTVAAEAMNAGTPVVAAQAGGLAEVVEDGVTGRLVPPDDPAALATAVLEVLQHRAAMGAAGRARARRWHADRYAGHVAGLIAPVGAATA